MARLVDLDAVQVYTMYQTSPRVSRPARLVRRSDPEQCHLILITRGSFLFSQAGRHTTLSAGDLLFYDSSRAFDGSVIDDGEHAAGGQIQVRFPRSMLPHPALIDDLIGCRLPRSGVSTLVSGYLRELVKTAGDHRACDAAGLAAVTMDLVAALVAHESTTAERGDSDLGDRALRNRILEFMRRRLRDPALTPATIAAAHHISVRYLHKLFQHRDLTVAAWIRRQRLEQCRHELADPRRAERPIHAVAAHWGFTSNAHFSRLFRATYGFSPSEYRQLAAGGTAVPR